jgi:hypothetical protein
MEAYIAEFGSGIKHGPLTSEVVLVTRRPVGADFGGQAKQQLAANWLAAFHLASEILASPQTAVFSNRPREDAEEDRLWHCARDLSRLVRLLAPRAPICEICRGPIPQGDIAAYRREGAPEGAIPVACRECADRWAARAGQDGSGLGTWTETFVPNTVSAAAKRILNRTEPDVDPGDAALLAGFIVEVADEAP